MNDGHVRMLGDYFQLMNINGASHVYREAVAAGLLDALRQQPHTAASLARACKTAERPTALVLDVLTTLGVVRADGDTYRLTPLAEMLLGSSYRDLSDGYWAHLPRFLRSGEPLMAMDDTAQSETHYQAQAAALAWMLAPAAEAAARALAMDQRQAPRILDLGAGSAIWSLTFARHAPDAHVTAVDWPAVLEVARATAQRMGLADRLTPRPGNYRDVALEEAHYDLAILGNVTHLETRDGNQFLFNKVCRALRPAGQLAILDVFEGSPDGGLNRALYSLGLALRTREGRVHPVGTLTNHLHTAGFGNLELLPLPVPPHALGLLLARKPAS